MENEREFKRKWDLMQRVLGAEARGEELGGFSSTRTLFGIKSHAEEVIERAAAEEDARLKAQLKCAGDGSNSASSGEADADVDA